jgi:hypothetical protein
MTLEEELLTHLSAVVPEGETKARNIAIVVFYFGFGELAWPTLEETGVHFGIRTRERVRQIIASDFRDCTRALDLPELRQCAKYIASSSSWICSELLREIERRGWAPPGAKLRGILNLMHGLNMCADYELYDGRISSLSRASLSELEDCFVLSKDFVPKLKKAMRAARSLPGLLGLADIEYLRTASVPKEMVLAALRMDPDTWIGTDDDRIWYCYEDRDNTLINASEKVFGITRRIEISRLADSLANHLRRRTSTHEYPRAAQIEKYIRGSKFFECDALLARFEGDTTDLTEVEKDTVAFLKRRHTVFFAELRDHLVEKGYGEPLIQKATNSSLVYVDKSSGPQHYTYSLVTRRSTEPTGTPTKDDRYAIFASRLKQIEAIGSDATVEAIARREQSILSQWLFDGKQTCRCAICGEEYGVSAVITAHKKKRSLCNQKERLDPYIVMPLCVFGCDHLYENRLVAIAGGKVVGHPKKAIGVGERKAIEQVSGRRIPDEWLRGDATYFD